MRDESYEERWSRHPDPQVTTAPVFWDRTGWKPEDLKDKVVLDAGCGCGRFSKLVQDLAEKVIAIDASDAGIEAAKKNAPKADARVEDILNITTIAPESVDYAFSIGVLDHTGDTRKAVAQVAKTVKVGGQLAVWVYPRPVPDVRLLPVLNFMHELTKAVPSNKLYDLCAKYSPQIRDIYRDLGGWDALQQIVRVSPSADDSECISDTFDWHCPMHRDWHTTEELIEWFEENGFEVTRIGTAAVNVCGTKVRGLAGKEKPIAQYAGKPREREKGEKPKVLLVADEPNRELDLRARAMVRFLPEIFDFDIAHVGSWSRGAEHVPDMKSYDVIGLLYHRWRVEHLLPLDRTVVLTRSERLHEEDRELTAEEEVEIVNRYRALASGSRSAVVRLSKLPGKTSDVRHLVEPVDMQRFPNTTRVQGNIVATWNGDATYPHGSGDQDIKGFYTILKKACREAQVQFNTAEIHERFLGPGALPEFYCSTNVSLFASRYAVDPRAAMEGMACGHVLITTYVDPFRDIHASEMHHYGEGGIIFVERTVKAFADALKKLKENPEKVRALGEINRVEIATRWSWKAWRDRYAAFLRLPLAAK